MGKHSICLSHCSGGTARTIHWTHGKTSRKFRSQKSCVPMFATGFGFRNLFCRFSCNSTMYICLAWQWTVVPSSGDWAWERWPSCRPHVERVRADNAFYVQDLSWIAGALDIKVRCTIRPDVHQAIKEDFPALLQDCVLGHATAPVTAHLFFSWATDSTGEKTFGHFDLLRPTSEPIFAMELAEDVAWFKNYMRIYIYIWWIC